MNIYEVENLLQGLGWRRTSEDPTSLDYRVYAFSVAGETRIDVPSLEGFTSNHIADILLRDLYKLEGNMQAMLRSKADIIRLELRGQK